MEKLNISLSYGKATAQTASLTITAYHLRPDGSNGYVRELATQNSTIARTQTFENIWTDHRGVNIGRMYRTDLRAPGQALLMLDFSRTRNGAYSHRFGIVLRVRSGAAYQRINLKQAALPTTQNADEFGLFFGRADLLSERELREAGIDYVSVYNVEDQIMDLLSFTLLSPETSKAPQTQTIVTYEGVKTVQAARAPSRRLLLAKKPQ